MPTLIVKGADTTTFDYAPDNSRIYREDKRGTEVTKTWYLGKVYEVAEKAGSSEERWYLGNVVLSKSSKNSVLNYEVLHSDSQGSTVTVTDGAGALVSHSLYDAWGQQSSIFVGSTSQLFVQSLQRRGYTGHENVDGMGIIHMNGRIYDPLLARFVQADPTLQFPEYTQGYNRYAYVLNNPMTYTDPSGYSLTGWLGRKLMRLVPQDLGNFIIGFGSKLCGPWAGACAAAATYEFSRAHGMSKSGALRAAAVAGASAYAFGKIGEYYSDLGDQNWLDAMAKGGGHGNLINFGGNLLTAGQVAGQIAAHAVTGGVLSYVGGGKFGHGFFSAGVTKGLGTPLSHNFGQGVVSGTLTQMLIGGTTSVISGGKFANGARTAAYQALFNHFRGNTNFRQIFSDVRRTFGEYLDWLKFEQATSAIDAASKVLKDGQSLKMDGCAGFYLGACASLSVTNDSVIFSRGVGRVFGASIGAGFVPINADKTNGVTSWSSGVSVPLFNAGFELDYTKGSKPQLDVMVGGTLGFSINHTLMYHSVYTPRGK